MRSAAPMLLLALPALALAGCVADEPPVLTTHQEGLATGAGTALPTWDLGDHWVYEVRGERATYVVTEDLGSHWRMDTDSPARAFQDAVDDISRLGPQRKSDLAGSQGTDTVEFFRWPLEAGARWTTTWDKVPLTVQVLEQDAAGARLEARSGNGTLVYTYSYDAEAEWFGGLVHWNPDGSEQVRLTLAGAGHGWAGTAVRYQVLAGPTAASNPPILHLVPFEVPAGTTDLWVRYAFACEPAGTFAFNLAPKSGEGRGENMPCQSTPVAFEGVYIEAPVPGPWGLTALTGGVQGSVAYEVLLRTMVEVKVTQAQP